jgi:hypothetical protein
MQGVDLSFGAAQLLLGTAAAPQSKGILDKLWGGVEKVTSLPQRTAEINTGLGLMREGAQTASQGLVKTEEGLAHFTASAELARQGGQTLKQAAKVVGIGVAIAGTVAIGGAIYGAARGSEENALGSLKGKALP